MSLVYMYILILIYLNKEIQSSCLALIVEVVFIWWEEWSKIEKLASYSTYLLNLEKHFVAFVQTDNYHVQNRLIDVKSWVYTSRLFSFSYRATLTDQKGVGRPMHTTYRSVCCAFFLLVGLWLEYVALAMLARLFLYILER